MAPIEPVQTQSNLVPLLATAAITVAASASLFSIGRSFLKLRSALPISSRTRSHGTQRRRNVIVFAVLAAISLAVNSYNIIELFVDSYTHFVVANNVIPENDVWSSPLWLPRYKDIKSLQLGAWLNGEDLVYLVESLFASPRDYWWFQQLQSAFVLWVMFLAVQGRRHKIPHTWTYLLLAAVFGLAVPVNLLFIALLLTPVPFERTAKPNERKPAAIYNTFEQLGHGLNLTRASKRPATWAPKPAIPVTLLSIGVLCQFVTPYIGGDSLKSWILAGPSIAAFAAFLVEYTGVLPASLGKTYKTVHEAHASYKTMFRIASISAFVLHIVSTVSAILANAPPVYRARFHFLDTSGDTVGSMSSSYYHAVIKTLGAFSDSPLVQFIGWDVLLTGLSIVVWAGIRGLHPSHLISSIGMPVDAEAASAEPIKRVANKVSEKSSNAAAAAESRIRSAIDEEEDDEAPTTRSRGTTTKSKTTSSSPPATTSRRGRPSKAQLQRAAEEAAHDPEGEDADPTFQPSADVAEATEHDEHVEVVDAAEQAESGAVAWGVLVLGGLGVGMASVCGAEVI